MVRSMRAVTSELRLPGRRPVSVLFMRSLVRRLVLSSAVSGAFTFSSSPVSCRCRINCSVKNGLPLALPLISLTASVSSSAPSPSSAVAMAWVKSSPVMGCSSKSLSSASCAICNSGLLPSSVKREVAMIASGRLAMLRVMAVSQAAVDASIQCVSSTSSTVGAVCASARSSSFTAIMRFSWRSLGSSSLANGESSQWQSTRSAAKLMVRLSSLRVASGIFSLFSNSA